MSLAALLRHRVPPALEYRHGFDFPPTCNAPRQRDYRCLRDLTSMERRGSALPPRIAFAYHCPVCTEARRVRVPRTFTTAARVVSLIYGCAICERVIPALMSLQELASRSSNCRSARAARDPRTTTGPFASFAQAASAARACIPETLLLRAPPQDAER